ncbi:hypothetical protein DDE18_21175 [Nocardioides gansuensis]|uniref:Oligopeptide/dipeptide ABC transporter C-terminal domain-containing protein n=1 Tax=Nocardioides gansuensis TaxID=2138300 RepID=A0A2T8F4X2_9ACTN|nr:oligopeptide/dipeptide ABC transporter ATP-binding protein [Nocardioides gansuensis]PVG80766.1 hypothetical protein DDE18_21175 [Nocardioides gansuensis]
MLHAAPGRPETAYLGNNPTPDKRAAVTDQLALDRPLCSTRPEYMYTRAQLAAAPAELVIGCLHVDGLTGEMPSAINAPSGCRFHTRCPVATSACVDRTPP